MPPGKAPATRAPRVPRAAPSKRARPTPPPADSPPRSPSAPPPYSPLSTAIAGVFAAAQKTTAGHRKLVINLRSTYEQCISGTGTVGSTIPGGGGQKGEKAFVKEFCRFLNRVLVVKKSEVVGDRCLRFADLFVRGLLEKDKPKSRKKTAAEANAGRPEEEDEEEEEEEEELDLENFTPLPPHRFVLALLQHLTPLLSSKEKSVRYRTSQLLSLLLSNSLPTFPFEFSSVSNKIFIKVRNELSKRLKDKEAVVRVQAAVGIVRLMEMGVGESGESDGDATDEEVGAVKGGALDILIEAMQNDPSADVRRTILYNVSPTPHSLPYLLERTRDTDAATRRSVFTRLLPTLGDFRHLSIGMREKILRWGLNDRDESVRVAARKMFNFRWVEDAGGDLLEVLERLDVTGDGSQGGVKELALKGFWNERKDVIEQLMFDDEYWENLTAESAFLVRSFNDYSRSVPEESEILDEKMPEVTKLAFWLQRYMNKLVAAIENEDEEASELEFIVEQMLMIASKTDYGDEIGRRKMFALLRESLSIPELTEGVTKLVVECLGKLSMGEGDFCMLVLEVIAEVHDAIEEDQEGDETVGEEVGTESFHSAQSDIDDGMEDTITVKPGASKRKEKEAAKKAKVKVKKGKAPPSQDEDVDMMDVDMMDVEEQEDEEDEEDEEAKEEAKAFKEMMINLKCLHIAQCMLENVEGSLKQNTHLVSMLNGLIVPAVRSHEAPVRERGLHCLGLSCLLDRTLAEENLTLFAHCFNKGHEALQIEALHIISDILTTHGSALFTSESCAVDQRALYRMFAKGLKLDDAIEVQATAAEVVCKLMLAQVIQDEELLKFLVVAYFDPATVDNQSLRQILTYFFPVYCHSRPENQSRMRKGAVGIVHALMLLHDNLGEEEEMVSLTVIASQLADWTDPRKNVGGGVQAGRGGIAEKIVDPDVHVDLASDILERVSGAGCSKEEKKVLITMLSKLYIPADATPEKLRSVYDLVAQAIEDKVATDAPSRNALNKIEVSLSKIVGELAEAAREETMIVAAGDETDAGGETDGGAKEKGDEMEESEAEGSIVTAIEREDEEEGDVEEEE